MPDKEYYKSFLIHKGSFWNIYLYVDKPFTCYLGRIYIWSRRDEEAGELVDVDIDSLPAEEVAELYELRTISKRILYKLFQPDRFNWAELTNIATHPHGHLIPRYSKSQEFNGETWIDKRWGKNAWPYKIDRIASEGEKRALLEVLKEAFNEEFC